MTKQLADELTALAERATPGLPFCRPANAADDAQVALLSLLRRELPTIIAALSTRSDGWQNIESTPRDGTPLLLFARCKTATAPVVQVGWHDPDWGWVESSFTAPVGIVPTHWRPLPTPPETTT